MAEVDSSGRTRPIAFFSQSPYFLDNPTDQRLNIDNFLMKTLGFVAWARRQEERVTIVITSKEGRIAELADHYAEMGFDVIPKARDLQSPGVKAFFWNLRIGYMGLYGGLDASILTGRQATIIPALRPPGWKKWSQRQLDGYMKKIAPWLDEGVSSSPLSVDPVRRDKRPVLRISRDGTDTSATPMSGSSSPVENKKSLFPSMIPNSSSSSPIDNRAGNQTIFKETNISGLSEKGVFNVERLYFAGTFLNAAIFGFLPGQKIGRFIAVRSPQKLYYYKGKSIRNLFKAYALRQELSYRNGDGEIINKTVISRPLTENLYEEGMRYYISKPVNEVDTCFIVKLSFKDTLDLNLLRIQKGLPLGMVESLRPERNIFKFSITGLPKIKSTQSLAGYFSSPRDSSNEAIRDYFEALSSNDENRAMLGKIICYTRVMAEHNALKDILKRGSFREKGTATISSSSASSPMGKEEQMIQKFVNSIKYAIELAHGTCIPHAVALRFTLWLERIDSKIYCIKKSRLNKEEDFLSNFHYFVKAADEWKLDAAPYYCYFCNKVILMLIKSGRGSEGAIIKIGSDLDKRITRSLETPGFEIEEFPADPDVAEEYLLDFDKKIRSKDNFKQISQQWEEFLKVETKSTRSLLADDETLSKPKTSSPVDIKGLPDSAGQESTRDTFLLSLRSLLLHKITETLPVYLNLKGLSQFGLSVEVILDENEGEQDDRSFYCIEVKTMHQYQKTKVVKAGYIDLMVYRGRNKLYTLPGHNFSIIVTGLDPNLPRDIGLGKTLFWLLLAYDASLQAKEGMIASAWEDAQSMVSDMHDLDSFEFADDQKSGRHIGFKVPELTTEQLNAIKIFLDNFLDFKAVDNRSFVSTSSPVSHGKTGCVPNFHKQVSSPVLSAARNISSIVKKLIKREFNEEKASEKIREAVEAPEKFLKKPKKKLFQVFTFDFSGRYKTPYPLLNTSAVLALSPIEEFSQIRQPEKIEFFDNPFPELDNIGYMLARKGNVDFVKRLKGYQLGVPFGYHKLSRRIYIEHDSSLGYDIEILFKFGLKYVSKMRQSAFDDLAKTLILINRRDYIFEERGTNLFILKGNKRFGLIDLGKRREGEKDNSLADMVHALMDNESAREFRSFFNEQTIPKITKWRRDILEKSIVAAERSGLTFANDSIEISRLKYAFKISGMASQWPDFYKKWFALRKLSMPADDNVSAGFRSSSPVEINHSKMSDLIFMPWRTYEVPGRRAVPTRAIIEIFITPVEEKIATKKACYLFWRAQSLLDRFWDLLAGFFESLRKMFKKIFSGLRRIEKAVIPRKIRPLTDSRVISIETTIVSTRGDETVGAVVASSSVVVDPAKGDPNDPVWRKFYRNKLDPLTPRHEVYYPQFVKNFMDPDRGDWQEFRKTVEADKGSPWRV
ncbi:MAG: hypothetical protein KAR32_11380, partial [Candidatus Omnitrophica bacterium]|nr:hypothetical protein [Candidatus Omnitrophota bacterium]